MNRKSIKKSDFQDSLKLMKVMKDNGVHKNREEFVNHKEKILLERNDKSIELVVEIKLISEMLLMFVPDVMFHHLFAEL